MVRPAANVPISVSCKGQKTYTVEVPKGTIITKDGEKGKGKDYTCTRPIGLIFDKAHYDALKNADVNHDHRIDAKDAALLKGKKGNVTSTTPYYIKSKEGQASFGILLTGGVKYNQANARD
jgi:hypothetical protein